MERSSPPTQHASRKANRLIREKSPYLLQHAYNPVDWYPWGEEAFAKAEQEGKPVFLSIGYSTCHWCHVMEHESFEDPEIAALLNQWFVSIKVDREEHPDLDQVYMNAVTTLTGQGGWPLTVFLTPDLKPFFGGTYFPPEQRGRMAGMKEVLPAVAEAWKHKRGEIVTSAEQLTASLNEQLADAAQPRTISLEMLHAAFNQAAGAFDASAGGFGGAPKFPRSHELSFLLRYWIRTGTAQALEMVTTTLDHLARGGIYDHLGGGFHRYSTDARWLVPHFEKMLYDQALLARTYLEAYRITKRSDYADVARGILEYVLRDLTDPKGGCYSAEDADSEGEEGKFYVWTQDEVVRVLGQEEGELFNRFYGVTPSGNFEHGASILNIEQPLEPFAKLKGFDPQRLAQRLASSRARLLTVRATRVRPHRDDKVLTSWNGLMIAAFAYGASTLNEPRYYAAAQQATEFILTTLAQGGGLLRRYRDGEALYPGTLEDYAFFSDGLLELYEASFDPRWLSHAKRLAEQMIERFWDDQGSGFFLRGKDEAPLIVRSKEIYDGATPSGNAVAVLVLVRLGRLTADRRLEEFGRRALEGFAKTLERAPFGYPQMFSAMDFALGPTKEIVIAGDPAAPETVQMVQTIHERFLPRAVAVLHPEGHAGETIEALVPYVKTQEPLRGKPTAYVCEDFICKLPTTDLTTLAELLQR
jgi:uncharacterized protein YyaL (SSP411 family)